MPISNFIWDVDRSAAGTVISGDTATLPADSARLAAQSYPLLDQTVPTYFEVQFGSTATPIDITPGFAFADGNPTADAGYVGYFEQSIGYYILGPDYPARERNASRATMGPGDSANAGEWLATDRIGFAFIASTGKFWISRNGVWIDGDPDTQTNPTWDLSTQWTAPYFDEISIALGGEGSGGSAQLFITSDTWQNAAPTGFSEFNADSPVDTTGTLAQPFEIDVFIQTGAVPLTIENQIVETSQVSRGFTVEVVEGSYNWVAGLSHPDTLINGSLVKIGEGSTTFRDRRSAHAEPLGATDLTYWEFEVLAPWNDQYFGFGDATQNSDGTTLIGLAPDSFSWRKRSSQQAEFYLNGSKIEDRTAETGGLISEGDILMFAFDATTGNLWLGSNGTWLDSGDPSTLINPTVATGITGPVNPAVGDIPINNTRVEADGLWSPAAQVYQFPTGFTTPEAQKDVSGPLPLPFEIDVFVQTGFAAAEIAVAMQHSGQIAQEITVAGQQTGRLPLPLDITVPEVRQIETRFEIAVRESVQVGLPFVVDVTNPTGGISLPFEVVSNQTGQIGVGVSVSVFDSSQPHRCQWSARVLLDNVDVSARLTEQISVSASEGAARVATFTLKPFAGVVDPNQWVGKKVVIDYLDADQVQRRLFSGFVDTPRYNATDRLTTFECSDLLQNSLEGSEREQIDRLVGGFWSDLVFDADADGWRYAQDRLSTIPASLDLDRFGSARVTAWQSKASPDFSFASERVVNGSLGVSLVSRRELLNRVQLVAEYRYGRNWQAEKRFSWYFDNTLCQQLRDEGKTTPNRPMIEAAIDSSGWLPKSIDYTPPPSSRDVRCPGSATVSFWSISDELRDFLVWGVRYVIARRWSQSLTESYAVTVEAPESIEAVGEISKEQRTGFQSENPGDWDKWETYEESNGEPVSTGVTYSNQDERQSADTALLALIGRTRADILKSHRANSVSFQTLIQPEMERTHTAKIETETVIAQGKVSGITHILDFATGSALTDVQLAVSRKLGDQTAQDSGTVAPAAPADEFGDSGTYSTQLESQYGGRFSSGEQQEIEGYTGNYDPPDSGAPLFDVNWAFTAPAIDASFTESKTLESPSVNRIAIPDDLLEMVA